MSGIVEWVSDRLHDILGLSDRYTAEFLVGLAKKSSSADGFLRKLKDTGAIAINETVSSFAVELWNKVPHKKVDTYKASRDKEKAALVQQQKNKSYRLLSDEEDEPEKVSRVSKKSALKKETKSRKRRNIRKEKASAWESESESEGEQEKDVKRSRANSDSDEWEK